MADDADSCGLAAVSYGTWNCQNYRNTTPLQISAQPNFYPIPKANFLIYKVIEEEFEDIFQYSPKNSKIKVVK